MIQIRNISKGRPNEARVAMRTNWGAGTAAFPIRIELGPGQTLEVPAASVDDWDPGVKEFLAEYMAHGLIAMYTVDSVHQYQDKNHNAIYDLDYLIGAEFGPLAQTHAYNMAATLHEEMNAHFAAITVHNSAVGTIAGAAPATLADLITWIGVAQTQYTTHGASIAAHVNVDTVNVLTPVVAADWATSISALRELHRVYHSHKKWYGNAVEMDINAVLTY